MAVVPQKYIKAELTDLPIGLQKIFAKDIEIGVLLWGATGNGKTYSLAALSKKYIVDGYIVKRIHYEILCLLLRDTYNAPNSEWDVIEPLLNCDKLIIEDIGTTQSIGKVESDFSRRTLTVILDIRMENCRPTFITSNKSVENLSESFDERIGDRLRTFHIFNLGKKSKRSIAK